jgi:hypothetical protein
VPLHPAPHTGTFVPVEVLAVYQLLDLLEATSASPAADSNSSYAGAEGTVGLRGAPSSGGSPETPWSGCPSPSTFPAVPRVVYINTKAERCPSPAGFTPVCTKLWLERRAARPLRYPAIKQARSPGTVPINASSGPQPLQAPPARVQPPRILQPPLPPGQVAHSPVLPIQPAPPGLQLLMSAPPPPPPPSSCSLISCMQGSGAVEVYACDRPVVPPPGMVPLQVEQGACSWGVALAGTPSGQNGPRSGPTALNAQETVPAGRPYSGSPAAGAWTPPLYGGASASGRQAPPGQGPAAGAEGCRLVDSCQLNIPGFNDGTHRAQVYICDQQPVRPEGSQRVEAAPAVGCPE